MLKRVLSPLFLVSLLAACGTSENAQYEYPVPAQGYESHLRKTGGSALGGDGGISIFGGDNDPAQQEGTGSGITVNAFLWRASVDTVSFMPLNSADPFGGVIITDWYQPPDSPGERFKVNVFILSRELRADGIRAAVFKQRNQDGTWADTEVSKQTVTDLENAILKRARELRIASLK